ncbi:hypothetical protein CPLU01_11068 [Colletotrichum plurivorum]|uniref:Heterokaryon incompatibility domain-containing protein n=1 Tax=Colletotrichum plurivorum TaxID=2175906 RepID=A0A8H6N8A8_9PEZI|nr:hypothetical protein CPLU01_11068 [Colletotrichum plurivorum]
MSTLSAIRGMELSSWRPGGTRHAPARPSTEPPRATSRPKIERLKFCGPKTTTALISLFDIIKKSRNKNQRDENQHDANACDTNVRDTECKFCTLLFDAIALPSHDPFEHPAMKEHMPREFKGKTFETWAKGIKWHDTIKNTPHPFGQGRNKIEIEQDKSDPSKIIEVRNRGMEAAAQLGVVAGAGAAGAVMQAGSQEKDKDQIVMSILGSLGTMATAALSLLDHKIPVGVAVTLHNGTDDNAGLLNVKVFGYGSKLQASLSNLSEFNLRVASDYEVQKDGLGLHYGRIVEQEVKVGEDCNTWLSHCREYHGDLCGQPDWSLGLPLPSGDHFRLIDIRQTRVVPVRVNGQQENLPVYAALSYVWGETGRMALNLNRGNLSQLGHRIDDLFPANDQQQLGGLGQLPGQRKRVAQTILDAARHDDKKEPAQEEQIKQMDSIFGHADVVIVAASGEDAEAGLAGISVPRNPGQTGKEIRPNVNVLLPVQYDDSYGVWDTRAWTLQERLLSKRMLVFGSNHVSFHCRHGILREDMPATHACNGPPRIPHLSMPPNSGMSRVGETWERSPVLLRSPFFNEYAKLLEQYTSRDMSDIGDILNGMLGLLRVLENMRNFDSPNRSLGSTEDRGTQRGDHTLYGLPEEFLDIALLWQPTAVKGTYLTKRSSDVLPSWSWTGWEVSKDPSHGREAGKNPKAHPGVRFEEPFWVSGNDDMSLRKFIATESHAEERFKPLLMWYRCLKKPTGQQRPPPVAKKPSLRSNPAVRNLKPVNGTGIGYLCGSEYEEQLCLNRALKFRKTSVEGVIPPSVPADIPLDNRHLVCETDEAKFRLRKRKESRKELLWKRVDGVAEVEKELEILEAEILDQNDDVVGCVIPIDQRKTISTHWYHFILLSESQYWGNEDRIDIIGYPLYNIMLIEWDNRREFAQRIGMGKINRPAWKSAGPKRSRVILK